MSTNSRRAPWSRTCIDCHEPHVQGQKYWKNVSAAALFLASGQIDAYSCDDGGSDCQIKLNASQALVDPITTLTYSSGSFKSGWVAADMGQKTKSQRGAVLIPNLRKTGWTFPVIAMDGTTITVKGYIGTDNVYQYNNPPTSFGIIYGQFLRQYINADNDGGNTYETQVKIFDKAGTSFAVGNGSGICEVCHTDTAHGQNDGVSGSDPDHTNVSDLASANPNMDFMNCVFCHNHQDGFRPSCPDCHGLPPTDQAVAGGPDGRVGPDNVPDVARWDAPSATGSGSVGMHELHATSAGYDYPCQTCHSGGMSTTMTKDNQEGDGSIQIGFSSKEIDDHAVSSGGVPGRKTISGAGTSYTGQAGVTYQGTSGTTVLHTGAAGNGSLVCTNTYCHSNGRAVAANLPISFSSLAWDDSSPDPQGDNNKCNNCHGNWTLEGDDTHYKHALYLGYTCYRCHSGTVDSSNNIINKAKHINGIYDIQAGAPTTFGYTRPSSPGGLSRCSSISGGDIGCHANRYWNTDIQTLTATPGYSLTGYCAVNFSITVNPSVNYAGPYTCFYDWGDGTAELNASCNISHTFPSSVPGTQYSITWGVRNGDGVSFAAPGSVTSTFTLSDADSDGIWNGCDLCPNDPLAAQIDNEGDGVGDACDADDDNDGILDDGDSSGTVGDNYCIGGNTSNCDDNCQFTANSNQADTATVNGIGNACEDTDGDGISDLLDICPNDNSNHIPQEDLNCTDCHGEPPTVDAPGVNGLVYDPVPTMCNTATASATAGTHAIHASATGYNFPCVTCHFDGMLTEVVKDDTIQIGFNDMGVEDYSVSEGGVPGRKTISGANTSYTGQAGVSYQGTHGTTVSSTGAADNGTLVCTNTYCHSNGKTIADNQAISSSSLAWDNSSADPQSDGNTCNNCHEYWTLASGDTHYSHVVVLGYPCERCHFDTVTGSNTIKDKSKHSNGIYDIKAGPGVSFNFNSPVTPGGQSRCSAITGGCHANRYWNNN